MIIRISNICSGSIYLLFSKLLNCKHLYILVSLNFFLTITGNAQNSLSDFPPSIDSTSIEEKAKAYDFIRLSIKNNDFLYFNRLRDSVLVIRKDRENYKNEINNYKNEKNYLLAKVDSISVEKNRLEIIRIDLKSKIEVLYALYPNIMRDIYMYINFDINKDEIPYTSEVFTTYMNENYSEKYRVVVVLDSTTKSHKEFTLSLDIKKDPSVSTSSEVIIWGRELHKVTPILTFNKDVRYVENSEKKSWNIIPLEEGELLIGLSFPGAIPSFVNRTIMVEKGKKIDKLIFHLKNSWETILLFLTALVAVLGTFDKLLKFIKDYIISFGQIFKKGKKEVN